MSMVAEYAHLSGLEQMRALMRAGVQPGIGRTLGFSLTVIEEGLAVFEGAPDEDVYNPIGTVHGGYAAPRLDPCCGGAVQTLVPPGQGYTTLELKVAYHKAITSQTGKVRAEGRVLSFGRRAAFSEGKLLDAGGRLLASTSTLMILTP